MERNYGFNIKNASEVGPARLFTFHSQAFKAMEQLDLFLLLSLDKEVKCQPRLNFEGGLDGYSFELDVFPEGGAEENEKDFVRRYLSECKSLILSSNIGNNQDDFRVLLQKITEKAIEIDEMFEPSFEFDCKVLNKIKLAKALEKVTSINHADEVGAYVKLPHGMGEVTLSNKHRVKAIDLLGGKIYDHVFHEGWFTVKRVEFGDIEKCNQFFLDKKPVKVFIVHTKWLTKFNKKKITFAKGDTLRAKFTVEKCPVTNLMIYYIHEIYEKISSEEMTQGDFTELDESY